jgi:hypothetical protein
VELRSRLVGEVEAERFVVVVVVVRRHAAHIGRSVGTL